MWDRIILAIVQGVTELLPVSSSGHLILASELIDLKPDIHLIVLLHLASGVGIAFGYYREVITVIRKELTARSVGTILLGILPTAAAGALFSEHIDKIFYNSLFVSINLIIWGVAMILTERWAAKMKSEPADSPSGKSFTLSKIRPGQLMVIALTQIIALLPGTSRSGITTMAGMWAGLPKGYALDFSFMLGMPLLVGAFLFDWAKEPGIVTDSFTAQNIVTLFLTFALSYLAISLLKQIKQLQFLTFFGVYRIFIGVVILLLL